MKRVLVTGGAGFIGSHFVQRILPAVDVEVVTVLDALTYAGNIDNLRDVAGSAKLKFVKGDIIDRRLADRLVGEHTDVVHFAAESHVDRSFFAAGQFLSTNVVGTHTLLEAARRHPVRKFVHVSTDEVYGSLPTGAATEESSLRPTVPYAASKAASDMVARSYFKTFDVPVCITRSSNNYGPRQHPEKIIPRFVTSLLKGGTVTLHGIGEHVRDWLHVADNCQGIELVWRAGVPGQIYNISGGNELTNNELTARILDACGASWNAVTYVPDRRCNDVRYAMSRSKIVNDLGFAPEHSLDDGLAATVAWYRDNPDRWAPAQRGGDAEQPELQPAGKA